MKAMRLLNEFVPGDLILDRAISAANETETAKVENNVFFLPFCCHFKGAART